MNSPANSLSDSPFDTATIRPIGASTVHKICSGQVVVNLAVAVKELVENGLDAGATCIDVRLKNYGIDSIEVSDNGSGVIEENFAALTLKYHTSKLTEYSDLMDVSSFGFRGEALSSLCALSDLVITTRHKSADYATKIEYDNKGNIIKKTLCSRQIGTTVTLTNLFSSLPVRQKEFHKNAKREFTKMTQLLYAYCLISIGVKITCTNQTKTNPKSIVVSTQGSNSYKDNIACVFGIKQLQSLIEIKPHPPSIKENIFKSLTNEVISQCSNETVDIEDVDIDLSEESNDTDNINSSQDDQISASSQWSTKSQGVKNKTMPFEFQGYISSCAHGSGRSTTDKQFYFVNSRPCDPTKVIKLVNEVYKQFNPHQYPFVLLNFKMQQSSVDVNVTPDKRKVFLTKEKDILECLKSSLLKLFENIPGTLKVEVLEYSKKNTEDTKSGTEPPRIFNSFLKKFANETVKSGMKENIQNETVNCELKRKSSTMLEYLHKKNFKISSPEDKEIVEPREKFNKSEEPMKISPVNSSFCDINSPFENDCNKNFEDKKSQTPENFYARSDKDIIYLEFTDKVPDTQIRNIDEIVLEHKIICKTPTRKVKDSVNDFSETNNVNKNIVTDKEHLGNHAKEDPIINSAKTSNVSKNIITDKEDLGNHVRKTVTMKTSLEHITALTEIFSNQKKRNKPERLKFKTEINPVFNKKCEEELTREISKDSFKYMEIIGQFNLGFIITQLDDDLFIVDQHATDEIYNFETLQKTTELTCQKLVISQQLDLTGVNEQILMDNLPVFTKNGFTFEIDENAPPTKRVKLSTIPMSKNWIFGKDDVEELLFMLREAPIEHCRPSRVRAMFASRACRKSVMIGTALSKADMKKLIEHMEEIEKPWNCPHGRPTIRHLVNLAMVQTE